MYLNNCVSNGFNLFLELIIMEMHDGWRSRSSDSNDSDSDIRNVSCSQPSLRPLEEPSDRGTL